MICKLQTISTMISNVLIVLAGIPEGWRWWWPVVRLWGGGALACAASNVGVAIGAPLVSTRGPSLIVTTETQCI